MSSDVLVAIDALGVALNGWSPDDLSAAECAAVVAAFAKMEKRLAAGRVRAAALAADGGAHSGQGFRDPVDWLARMSGISTGEARNAMETATLLDSCPKTRNALDAGELSVAQAGEIARTEAECPGSEDKLLDVATKTGLHGLKEAARKVRLESQDVEDLHRRQRSARNFRIWLDSMGMTQVRGAFAPDDGVPLTNMVQAVADRLSRAAYRAGTPEPHDRLAADALMFLVRGGAPPPETAAHQESADSQDGDGGCPDLFGADAFGDSSAEADALPTPGVSARKSGRRPAQRSKRSTTRRRATGPPSRRAELVLVCDLNAYRRGHTHPGETCHIIGGGPVPVDVARRQADEDPFIKAVLHDGVRIETIAHFGRHLPAHLRTALELGTPPAFDGVTCNHPGCDRHHYLQWDHANPVANHGPTSYQNLQPLCGPHHKEKTEQDRLAGLLHGAAKQKLNTEGWS